MLGAEVRASYRPRPPLIFHDPGRLRAGVVAAHLRLLKGRASLLDLKHLYAHQLSSA